MAVQDYIDELKSLDVNDLQLDNIGSWPKVIQGIVLLLAFFGALGAGYYFIVADQILRLETVQAQELELRQEFEQKAFKAANLEALKQQLEDINESFGALLGQLPKESEVPGLLEDITEKAVKNGLEISKIALQPERRLEFYSELPISIVVKGGYHDIAGFVSGIAGIPRIVTLHNYSLKSEGDNRLTMSVTAKTYRYKDE